jgi:hypothetical protein
VEFGASAPLRHNQACGLEDAEVLGDRLAGEVEAVPGGECGADFEEGLAVAYCEFVEDQAPGLIVECSEDVCHKSTIGK